MTFNHGHLAWRYTEDEPDLLNIKSNNSNALIL